MTEPLKLRVGGVYLNRRGERVEIVRYRDTYVTCPFMEDSGYSYTPMGRWSSGDVVTPFDLISEVTEAPPAPLPADDLRTRAAVAAMTGILANCHPEDIHHPKLISKLCVMHADALIAALKEATDGTE